MSVYALLLLGTDAAAQSAGTPVVPGRCDFYAWDGSIRRNWYCVEGTVGTGDSSEPPEGTEALLWSDCDFPTYNLHFVTNSGLRLFSLTGTPHVEGSNYSIFWNIDWQGQPLHPEQHCSVTAVEIRAGRMYYLAPPRDAYGSPQPGPWFFGNVACGPDRRPGSEQSCSGSYDVRLFAKYGSATGRVEYATNQPVADGWVVASELFNPDERYVVRTDGAGNYTFTKTDTAQLPVLPPDQAHPSTPSPASNNWGLPVFGDGGRPAHFPHFMIAISRQGLGRFLEEQGPRACGRAS
jgi:hypothetical protein